MYRVLYRKWRPQTFDDVAGQKHVTTTLANEVAEGRVSHAYLFTGSRGTGKTTGAKILAKAVNCLHPVNGNPCNECDICRGIDDGSILDVIEIDAASNNGVDNIRDLREEANFTPVNAQYRVYIIDEVHMLSPGAFNALLKTLEEPPEHVKFILATTEVHKLPATILSRCQRFDFHRISTEDMTGRLQYISGEEGIELDDDAAVLISRISDGALRDALSLLDRCSGISNHVTASGVSAAAGLAGKEYVFSLAECISNKDASGALTIIDKLHGESCDMERLCEELVDYFRNLMIIKTVKAPQDIILCTPSELQRYRDRAEKSTLSKILEDLSILDKAAVELRLSNNKRVTMEMTIIKLTVQENAVDLETRLERLEKRFDSEPVKPAVRESETKRSDNNEEKISPPPADNKAENSGGSASAEAEAKKEDGGSEKIESDVLFNAWPEVLEALNISDKPLTGILGNSSAYVRNDLILINCDNPVFPQFIRQPNHASAIIKAVYDITGRKFRLGVYKSSLKSAEKKDPLAELIGKINNS